MFNLMRQWLSSKGQGWPFSLGHSYWIPINILKQIQVKTPYDKLVKMYAKYFGHMTQVRPCPYMVKTI